MSLVEDYDLFRLAVPHHDEMQSLVGAAIGHFARTEAPGATLCVVEAGAGTGITTRELLDADLRVRVRSFDIEQTMVRQARARLRAYKHRVCIDVGDIVDVLATIPNKSVDAFASAFTLHHIERRRLNMLFKEIARVLKPGGVFVNADKIARVDVARHEADLREQIEAFSVFDGVGRPDLRVEWTKHYQLDDIGRIDEAAHHRMFSKAGFVKVKTAWRRRMEAIMIARLPAKP